MKSWAMWAAALIALGAPCAPAAEDARRSSERHYQAGADYYQKGDYARALEEWELAVRLYPANSEAKARLKSLRALPGIVGRLPVEESGAEPDATREARAPGAFLGPAQDVGSPSPSSAPDAVKVTARVDKKTPYVGEPLTLLVECFLPGQWVGGMECLDPQMDGLQVEPISTSDVGYYVARKSALFPTRPGELVIGPAKVKTRALREDGSLLSVESRPLRILVKALPISGRPADFSGAVGRFTVSAAVDRSEASVGEAILLTVTLAGAGSVRTLGSIRLPRMPSFKACPLAPSNPRSWKDFADCRREWTAALIPAAQGRLEVPSISLSYFDPSRQQYSRTATQPIPLEVLPAARALHPFGNGHATRAAHPDGDRDPGPSAQAAPQDFSGLKASARTFLPRSGWFARTLKSPLTWAIGFSLLPLALYLKERKLILLRHAVRRKLATFPDPDIHAAYMEFKAQGGKPNGFSAKELRRIFAASNPEERLLIETEHLPASTILELCSLYFDEGKTGRAVLLLKSEPLINAMAGSEALSTDILAFCETHGVLDSFLDRAMTLNPKLPLGAAARLLGEKKKPGACLKVLETMPKRDVAQERLRVDCLRSLGREGEAVDALVSVPIEAWKTEDFQASMRWHLKEGRLSQARTVFTWMERALPFKKNTAVYYDLARHCEAEGNADLALEMYRFILAADIDFEDVVERVAALKAQARGRGRETPASASQPAGGETVAARYRLLQSIGEGGMGLVLEAVDLKLERKVAVKKMRPEIRSSANNRKRFLNEAKIVAQINHPYIVSLFEVLEEGDEIYLVMEFMKGRPLSQVLEERGQLPLPETRGIMNYVCQAVDFAHRQRVLHRDLKPSNIMVDSEGHAKVMDFGLAWQVKQTTSLSTQADVSGTLAYMAPEQHMGKSRRSSDIFALGVCLYEMLTGKLPFLGPDFLVQKERRTYAPPKSLLTELPSDIEIFIDMALDPNPKTRIQDAMKLLDLLRNV